MTEIEERNPSDEDREEIESCQREICGRTFRFRVTAVSNRPENGGETGRRGKRTFRADELLADEHEQSEGGA